MQYYAKVNTADPRTGFISVGEYLTEKQVDALGTEKIAELVECGVLAASGDIPEAASPALANEQGQEETPPANEQEEAPTDHNADEADESDGDEDELPELDMTEDIVNDRPEEPAPAPKKGGRRKTE